MSQAGAPPALRTDLDWMALQASALYRHDANGRITAFNEPPGKVADAPLFFFARTRVGNLWRLHRDLPDVLVRELARLAGAEATVADMAAPPERAAAMRERLAAYRAVAVSWHGPAYRFPDGVRDGFPDRVPASAEGAAVRLGPEDFPRVAEAFPRLDVPGAAQGRAPWWAVVEDGWPVCVAYAATGPGPAVEVGVETLEGHRGRGHAVAAVAAWAQEIAGAGRIPLYSTAWSNAASRAVARKLGLTAYGSDFHLR